MPRNRLIFALPFFLLILANCAITDYPMICEWEWNHILFVNPSDSGERLVSDPRAAYIIPHPFLNNYMGWDDGSDQLITFVWQEPAIGPTTPFFPRTDYIDPATIQQFLYTHDAFDQTGLELPIDTMYGQWWDFAACPLARAANTCLNDDPFDYEYDASCNGARSLIGLVCQCVRIGEWGHDDNGDPYKEIWPFYPIPYLVPSGRPDVGFFPFPVYKSDPYCGCQAPCEPDFDCSLGDFFTHATAMNILASLEPTHYRGQPALRVPINPENSLVTFKSKDGTVETMPIFHEYRAYILPNFKPVLEMQPEMRDQLVWILNWTQRHGEKAFVTAKYGEASSSFGIKFRPTALKDLIHRFPARP